MVFENVSFSVDTNWKLGLIGRNGKGKTTMLQLLLGKYEYTGTIDTSTYFDYFPYCISGEQMHQCASEFLQELKPSCEEWRVIVELGKLKAQADLLYQPFEKLSHGERTKVLLAASLLTPAHLYIWDEPMNYIDVFSRMQLETLILQYQPTMLLVDHDIRFREKIATRVVQMGV